MIKEKRILTYTLSYILIGLIICLIGISDVFALTNKTIYSGVNSSGLTGSGYYNYGYLNSGGVQNTTTAQVGSTISGISYGFQFYYYEDIILNNTYTLKINFKDNDLLKNVNSSFFEIQTCTTNNCSNAIIISLEKSSKTGQSNWVILKFNPVDIGDIVSVNIGSEDNQPITGIENFGISSIQTEYTNENQDIIDNNNNNTNNIIDNNNNNTQNIIDNQDKNTNDIINSNLVCNTYNNTNIKENGFLDINGTLTSNSSWGITDYIPITSINTLKIIHNLTYSSGTSYCFYKNSKTLISCFKSTDQEINKPLEIPANTSYVRFSIERGLDLPTFAICKNGSQATNDSLNGLNSSLNDSNTSDATDDASNFFSNFTTDTFGLTSIITAPLSLINTITSSSCSSLRLPLPYLDNKFLELPCMNSIYSEYFGTFFDLYQTITFGIVAYWVIVRIFNKVKDFKNPDHDEIEVLDL